MTDNPHKFEPLEPSLAEDPFTALQRLFVYFLQGLFEHEEFRGTGMFWDPDEKVTEMIISSEKPRQESLEKLPHLTVVLGTAQWSNLSMDQMQSMSMGTGQRTHTDLVAMTVSYHCQAKEGNTARRIAWYSSYYTNMFRRMLMRQGRIHHIGSGQSISAESEPSVYTGPLSTDEFVAAVVTIPFFWQPQWSIRAPASAMEQVGFGLNVKHNQIRPPRIRGRVIQTTPLEAPEIVLTQKGTVSED